MPKKGFGSEPLTYADMHQTEIRFSIEWLENVDHGFEHVSAFDVAILFW